MIGPGMGHKYDANSLAEIASRLAEFAKRGRQRYPAKISLQTPTLRYGRYQWIRALRLEVSIGRTPGSMHGPTEQSHDRPCDEEHRGPSS